MLLNSLSTFCEWLEFYACSLQDIVDISDKKHGKKKGKPTSNKHNKDKDTGDSSWVKKIAGPLLAQCGTKEAVEDDDTYGITDSDSDPDSDFDPERYGGGAAQSRPTTSPPGAPRYLENIEARLTGQGLDDDIESDGEDEVRFDAPECFGYHCDSCHTLRQIVEKSGMHVTA